CSSSSKADSSSTTTTATTSATPTPRWRSICTTGPWTRRASRGPPASSSSRRLRRRLAPGSLGLGLERARQVPPTLPFDLPPRMSDDHRPGHPPPPPPHPTPVPPHHPNPP